jgi:hypothetical protein
MQLTHAERLYSGKAQSVEPHLQAVSLSGCRAVAAAAALLQQLGHAASKHPCRAPGAHLQTSAPMNVSHRTQMSIPMNVDCQVVNHHLLACLTGHRGSAAGDNGQSVYAREAKVSTEVDFCGSVEG